MPHRHYVKAAANVEMLGDATEVHRHHEDVGDQLRAFWLEVVLSYSRWTDRSVHLCSKTVRATFMAHGSSVMRPLSSGIPPAVYNSCVTCDLAVHASPLRDIAPSRQGVGSSAYAALLRPITCTSPSARQPIRGITPGLCFLRDPSRHAMRLAPAHNDA